VLDKVFTRFLLSQWSRPACHYTHSHKSHEARQRFLVRTVITVAESFFKRRRFADRR